VQETKNILALLKNGNDLAIISPRRLGKTDLLRHCFSQNEVKTTCYRFFLNGG
jgi:hypothetical protein